MMTKATLTTVVLAAIMLSGCGPSPSKAPETAAPQPSQVMKDTFVGCTWQKVESATLSIWSYTCPPDHGNTRLVADDALPGFKFPDGSIAIRAFEKPAGAPVDAILDQIRAASPGPHSDTCVLTPIHREEQSGPLLFMFTPTGAAKTEWDAWEASADHAGDVKPPCGIMGPAMDGDRYFQALPDHPQTVVFVELGSEIQIFDVTTLRHR
jgi:hypothetical protein